MSLGTEIHGEAENAVALEVCEEHSGDPDELVDLKESEEVVEHQLVLMLGLCCFEAEKLFQAHQFDYAEAGNSNQKWLHNFCSHKMDCVVSGGSWIKIH